MNGRKRRLPAVLLLAAATGGALAQDNRGQAQDRPDPIVLAKSGGFVIGGKVLENPKDPGQHLSCDHGYVEYFLPATTRRWLRCSTRS